MIDHGRLRAAYDRVRDELLAERTTDGHWVGELSSSALSTATAVSALAVARRVQGSGFRVQDSQVKSQADNRGAHAGGDAVTEYSELSTQYSDECLRELVDRGIAWLVKQQNPDGGFGDTELSHSNIATTMLVVAALTLAGVAEGHSELLERANRYIDAKGRLQGLRERYGIDKTFVVPIMMNLALAEIVDWRDVDPLPFELACVPQAWYRFVGMPVVSYAIPALVAIGQARYFHAPPRNPFTRLMRWLSIDRSLRVLRRMQPDSGGYLEATPLTSFVVMSLASIPKPRPLVAVHDLATHEQTATTGRGFANEVIREGVKFLVNSVRPDGSWPIDTNLATWNTTLAINALAGADEDVTALVGPQCLEWLFSCRHWQRHPFTGAEPGGFGWSDLSGAVPDADDTPGAMIALAGLASRSSCLQVNREKCAWAYMEGLRWLQDMQNADGGWPTFCRGWGKLPFDRSGVDLTAHVARAIAIYHRFDLIFGRHGVPRKLHGFTYHASDRIRPAMAFISRKQHPDGSWSPLWFGNQDHPHEENPVYGTAKVLMAYRDLGLMDSAEAKRGVAWLVANQNEDGGWGSGAWGKARSAERGTRSIAAERQSEARVESLGEPVPSTQYSVPSTQHESVANAENPKSKIQNLKSSVEETALAVESLLAAVALNREPGTLNPCLRGLNWLLDRVEADQHRQPAPIGFYFAKLWYYERLYPLIFTVAALGRACRQFNPAPAAISPAEPPDFARA